jgi:hypothetical protein
MIIMKIADIETKSNFKQVNKEKIFVFYLKSKNK